MNNCKEVQDLILTDYMDGELKLEAKIQLERHLSGCPACQAFANEANENLVEPFQKLQRQEVPSGLWQNIRESIERENQTNPSPLDLVKGFLGSLTFPRLVPVLASFALVLFVGSGLILQQKVKQAENEEQVIYLASVLNAPVGVGDSQGNDLGTPIEQYFL